MLTGFHGRSPPSDDSNKALRTERRAPSGLS
jgi:hypothetical protein